MSKSPCADCQRMCLGYGFGCRSWQTWFIENWDRNIHRNVPTVPKRAWRYEHPDRVREMAAAQAAAEQKEDGDGER